MANGKKMVRAQFRQPKSGPGDLPPTREIGNREEAAEAISRFLENYERLSSQHSRFQTRLIKVRREYLHETAGLNRALRADFEKLAAYRDRYCQESKTTKTPCGDLCFHGGNTKTVELAPLAVMEDAAAALEARGIRIRIRKEVDKEAVKEAVAANESAIAGLQHLLIIQVSQPAFSIRTPDRQKIDLSDVEELRADTSLPKPKPDSGPKPDKVA